MKGFKLFFEIFFLHERFMQGYIVKRQEHLLNSVPAGSFFQFTGLPWGLRSVALRLRVCLGIIL